MRPVRILYIHNSAQVAGGNRALLGLYDHLCRRRFTPVAVLPGSGPMEAELRARGIRYHVVPFEAALRGTARDSIRIVLRFGAILAADRVRIIHANDGRAYRHASIAARLLGALRICHLQFPPEHAGLEWGLKIRPHVLITCSVGMGRELNNARLKCLKSVPILPVQNSVDTERFTPPRDIGELRRTLGIDVQCQVVTIVGTVSERKGHAEFLEIARCVLRRVPSVLFLVVGDDVANRGAYRLAMEDYARSLDIHSRVRFLGFRSDAELWVAASDVIVLPSIKEGLPLSLAEAHGCGKPVVSTRVDGIPEVVDDGVTGFLFEPHDVTGMCAAVTRLLQNEQLGKAMGEAGRERAVRVFSHKAHAAKVQQIYDRLLVT